MDRLIGRQNRLRHILVRYPRGLPIAIFAAVAAITVIASYSIELNERQSATAQLRARADAIAGALERRASANASYLRAGAALFASIGVVPPERFRQFVNELQLDSENRGAVSIGWARRIGPDQAEVFNRIVSSYYGSEARLHPVFSAGQAYAIPVTYLEPESEQNRRLIGYDMNSEPIRRAAMEEAARTERPTSTGKVMLVQPDRKLSPGFLIYMPVYASDAADAAGLIGYVYSTFGARDFLQSALRSESALDLAVRLYDTQVTPEHLVAEISPGNPGGTSTLQQVDIANHHWVIEVTNSRPRLLSALAVATLMFGLSVAVLLTVLVRLLTQQAIADGRRLSWHEEQTSIRDSLGRELNHRVKNTLANVLSIIALTRRRSDSLDEFAESLEGRIRALSATHDLLVKSDWGTTPVHAVIEAELRPYANSTGPTIAVSGPLEVVLAPKDALSLGLAIHELSTNAAKYGALSQPSGHLSVTWHLVEGAKLVRIDWIESGGPKVASERGRGFGLDLIEKIVAHELRNRVDLEFAPEGVRCTLLVPVRTPREFTIRENR